jgi:hypothetical protein
MRYLLVKNWDEFQHYKKRNPPWIKLYRTIVDDYHFAALKDKTKAHLLMIWLLASSAEGRVPHDAKFIASRINATEPIELDAIIAAGFLIAQEGAPEPVIQKTNGSHKLLDDTSPIVERIPLLGGEEFEVRESFAEELTRLYPNVDIPATLRQMRGWCIGNPTKLKTPRGIKKFITGWCERDQNGS